MHRNNKKRIVMGGKGEKREETQNIIAKLFHTGKLLAFTSEKSQLSG